MEGSKSSLNFITCDQLRAEFAKCVDDINKRVLIIDIRSPDLYQRSHLCLDHRNSVSSVATKMRVINIDPDLLTIPSIQHVMSLLEGKDLEIFQRRKDATDVIVIDSDTDNIEELKKPTSKVTRLINSLTRFDNRQSDKIVVPIQILKGGYREWILKYPHFTTDPQFDPDTHLRNHISPPQPHSIFSNLDCEQIVNSIAIPPASPPVVKQIQTPIQPNPLLISPNVAQPARPMISKPVPPPPSRIELSIPKQVPSVPTRLVPAIPKPPNAPTAPKPVIARNAPGTAVPVSPIQSLRSVLPRSHSSPNVAQADGDEPDQYTESIDHFNLNKYDALHPTINNNHVAPPAKPRFDRTLKPNFNREAVNAIRAQLNFGRSPEASGKEAITGLQNLGNTCFMNSVIQCLSYSQKLASYLCSEIYYNDINFNSRYGTKGELAIEFGALVEKLIAHRYRYIEPKSFRESIVKHIGFAGNEQQDSHEFMMMLFDKLHHDLNEHAKDRFKQNGINSNYNAGITDDNNINISRATLGNRFWTRHLELNKSIISELFEGIFMSTLTCSYCKGQSNTFEVFNCLSLPIPLETSGKVTRCHVRDCLSHFSNPERIEAAWECPICKQKREADKKIVICKLPQILIIHLKRFSLDEGRWRKKLQTSVDFPLNDLKVDCTEVLPQSAYKLSPYKNTYNLYAVVNHYGNLEGGHYTSFCKLDNQKWYTFDDSNVSLMRDTDVCSQAAYILFYAANG